MVASASAVAASGAITLAEATWSTGQRVTDLVYRMEQLDESFVGSTWTETAAIHEEASGAADEIAQQRDGQRQAVGRRVAAQYLDPFVAQQEQHED